MSPVRGLAFLDTAREEVEAANQHTIEPTGAGVANGVADERRRTKSIPANYLCGCPSTDERLFRDALVRVGATSHS